MPDVAPPRQKPLLRGVSHQVAAGVNLPFQVLPVRVFSLFAGHMALREAGDADAETALGTQVSSQFRGECEAAGSLAERPAIGGVAAQGQEVADAAPGGDSACGQDAGQNVRR